MKPSVENKAPTPVALFPRNTITRDDFVNTVMAVFVDQRSIVDLSITARTYETFSNIHDGFGA